jgi:hypothetical protein
LLWLLKLFAFEGVLHFLLPSLLIRLVNLHADLLFAMSTIDALRVVQIVLVVQDHGVHEIDWVVEDITLNHLSLLPFLILSVLMMISLIHGLIVVLLGPTPLIYDNCLLLLWSIVITLFLFVLIRA